MKQLKFLLVLFFISIAFSSNAQWYKFYNFIGDDADQMRPIWGWNLSVAFPFPLGEGLGHKMEENKWSYAFMATPIVNWETIYMDDELTIGKQNDKTYYYSDTNSTRIYESKFLTYKSRHRYIKAGAQFFLLVNYNKFLISLEIQPNYMIGGNVKHKFTEDGSRTTDRIRYKDDADYYNFRRFNVLSDLRLQYSWFVISAGMEWLPMFKKDLGPDITKTFFSFGIAIPPSMQYNKTEAIQKIEKREFDM
jgi:hypothetical protein